MDNDNLKKEIIVSVNDFEIISQYQLICKECEKEIISIDHPMDCDFIKCPNCGTKYFIRECLDITESQKTTECKFAYSGPNGAECDGFSQSHRCPTGYFQQYTPNTCPEKPLVE